MNRREFLKYTTSATTALTLSGGISFYGLSSPAEARSHGFSEQWLQQFALKLAKRRYKKPGITIANNHKKLRYDQYRDIRFNPNQSLWRNSGSLFRMQLFHTGFLYKHDVDLHLVARKRSRKIQYSADYFQFGKHVPKPRPKNRGGFSGFRIHTPINNQKVFDEFCVFQGASYFRAVAANQAYGLSARGLAINTGQPGGEEFPIFRSFWIEEPTRNSTTVTVHGLLDSESVVGVYKFVISPGNKTVMDVSSTLYPRKKMGYVGIAPLTSMFMLGPVSRRHFDDFRPRIHDSEGLCILNGKDELIWRPLINPKNLQFSSFVDENPKGFGLVQRERSFGEYHDLEANYEKRPSLWVQPQGQWGKGMVQLIEIPTDQEIHDNIVAFWKPEDALRPGQVYQYNYSLIWGRGPEINTDKAYVHQSRQGLTFDKKQHQFMIDYKLPAGGEFSYSKDMKAEIIAKSGAISNISLQNNDRIGGVRLNFQYNPQNSKQTDIRGTLIQNGKPISEVWVYRWES